MSILIVGAGPTGLTTALELTRQGVNCEIVEKRTGPSKLSRAVGIMPVSIELLKPSGVGDRILDEAMHFRKLHFHENGRRILSIEFPEGTERPKMILGLAQDRTEAMMTKTLNGLGVQVKYGTEVVAV